MNNTHALLLAFIEASGYEVERTSTGHVNCDCASRTGMGCSKCQGTGILHGTFDCKVTKKPDSYTYSDGMHDVTVTSEKIMVNESVTWHEFPFARVQE